MLPRPGKGDEIAASGPCYPRTTDHFCDYDTFLSASTQLATGPRTCDGKPTSLECIHNVSRTRLPLLSPRSHQHSSVYFDQTLRWVACQLRALRESPAQRLDGSCRQPCPSLQRVPVTCSCSAVAPKPCSAAALPPPKTQKRAWILSWLPKSPSETERPVAGATHVAYCSNCDTRQRAQTLLILMSGTSMT